LPAYASSVARSARAGLVARSSARDVDGAHSVVPAALGLPGFDGLFPISRTVDSRRSPSRRAIDGRSTGRRSPIVYGRAMDVRNLILARSAVAAVAPREHASSRPRATSVPSARARPREGSATLASPSRPARCARCDDDAATVGSALGERFNGK
jgi:hypothetical protein